MRKIIVCIMIYLTFGTGLAWGEIPYDGTYHSTESFIKMIKEGNEEYVKLFIENGINVNIKTHNGLTPLMWATITRQTSIVTILLDSKVDVNAQDAWGYTALMWTARYGYLEIAQILMAANASFTITENQFKWTPLMMASYFGKDSIVSFLIHKGADIHVSDIYHWTALTLAKKMQRIEVMRLLQQEGSHDLRCQPLPPINEPNTICQYNG